MTTYSPTVRYAFEQRQRNKQASPSPSPIGYAPGYEINPEQEDAIFALRRSPNTTVQRKVTTDVQVVRRGDRVLIVKPPQSQSPAQAQLSMHPATPKAQKPSRTTTAAAHRRHSIGSRQTEEHLSVTSSTSQGRGVHWLLPAGIGAVVMLAGYLAGSALLGWWQTAQDDLHYGRPRMYQTDVRVGHGDSSTPSHFIALNLNRHVEIIEVPGGDTAHSHLYAGPVLTGNGQDLAPVTLTFKDVSGDGKLDMIVTIQNEQLVYLNTGSAFRPSTPADHVRL
jgi:hypothetical protein